MNKKFLIAFLIFTSNSVWSKVSLNTTNFHTGKQQATLTFNVEPGQLIYKEYLSVTVDNPQIKIDSWHVNNQPITHFDPSFKENKKAYNRSFQISCNVDIDALDALENSHLHICYYQQNQKKIIEEVLPLHNPRAIEQITDTQVSIDLPEHHEVKETALVEKPHEMPAPKTTGWLSRLFDLATNTKSLSLRLLIILILGLLMSLTPCIYPMIPITAGILQSQSSKSLFTNFLLALCYTVGIATTFAILGLLAAFAGQAMGSIMTNPLFILPLVALLVYLALSMIGLYDMYTPKIFQAHNTRVSGGSFISAFLFGAASGIVASPCLSPGLVCLLCIVTTIGSKILGFLMLFVFGIGLSIPLLIIGTFSSSLAVLPRAGMWMVEIKKLFGFAMLGMCLYFLSYITPCIIMNTLFALSAITTGIIFLFYARVNTSAIWRWVYNSLAIVLIASSIVLAFKAYQSCHDEIPAQSGSANWQTNYAAAKQQALKENKKLFVDIGAPFCSICKAIDATLFANEKVQAAIQLKAVPVKIDGSDSGNSALVQQYKVIGFPTILLVDPNTDAVIKKWGPELYGLAPEKFVEELNQG